MVELSDLIAAFPVRAGAFIVTLYGDVVAPRGGELWVGNIIETCGAADISESRVRTAISRLVAADQVQGVRAGKRSFYRLTATAAREFQAAARLIYRQPHHLPIKGWHVVVVPQGPDREALVRQLSGLRFGFPTSQLAILPDRGNDLLQFDGALGQFRHAEAGDITTLVASAWPLDELNKKAAAFIAGFSPFRGAALGPDEALVLRLMLVHIYRDLALADPDLPEEVMPDNWLGAEARALFAELYLEIAEVADAAIAERFIDDAGPLRADPERLQRRLIDLGGVAG